MSSACSYRPAALALALLLSACAAGPPDRTPTADQDPLVARAPQGAVKVPNHPAGFSLISRHDYPDPAAGSSWRYGADSHPELLVDTFVYPTGVWPDAASAGDALAEAMRRDIEASVAAGLYEAVEVVESGRVRAKRPEGVLVGRHLRMVLRKDGNELISHAHLFYVPPYAVKVRSTFPAYGNRSFDARLKAVVDAFVADLRIDGAVLCRPVQVYVGPAGKPGWVALDGRDIIIDPDGNTEAVVELYLQAAKRDMDTDCPGTDDHKGAAPVDGHPALDRQAAGIPPRSAAQATADLP